MTHGARIEDADMVKASLHGVDASGASFRGTRIKGASLFRVDLRGADLPPPARWAMPSPLSFAPRARRSGNSARTC
ncbi:pentapeptide repeat-containing protein [Streptomyces goshikiensis]